MIIMQKTHNLSLLLWLVLAAVALAAYDDGALDYPLKELCRRWDHQSVVLDNKLYLVGGRVLVKDTLRNQLGNISSTWEGEPSSEFISLDLTLPFTLQKTDDNNNGEALPRWAPVDSTAEDGLNMTEALAVAGGGMWTRDNKLYLYEGQRTKGARYDDPSTLLSYDVVTSHWHLEKSWSNEDGRLPNRFSRGTSVNVPETGMGFYVGGARLYLGDDGTEEWVYPVGQQLVGMDVRNGKYDVKYQKIMDGITKTTGAAVTWIPVGERGSLIKIGGSSERIGERGSSMSTSDIAPRGSSLIPDNEVHIYDIAKDKWHVQLSSGASIPAARMHACAVAAAENGTRSYQVFYYGGSTGTRFFGMDDERFMGDLYVLNLPTFAWQKFTELKNPPAARTRHTCHVINNRQMLIVGGSRNDSMTVQAAWCRWDEISVLDMTDLRWELTYMPATEPYAINHRVLESSLAGGKVLAEPDLGWASVGLKELFTRNSTVNGSSSDEPLGNNQDTPGLPKGALIGIIVGAVSVVLFAIAGFLFWRRRRHARLRKEFGSDRPHATGSPGSQYDKKSGAPSPGFFGGEFGDSNKKSGITELPSDPAPISEMSAEPRPPAEMAAEPVIYELPTTESPPAPDTGMYAGGYLSDTSQSPNPLSRPVSDLSSVDPAQAGLYLRTVSPVSPVSPETVLEDITSAPPGPGASSSSLPRHEGLHQPTRGTSPI